MTQKDQIKVMNEGFTIVRADYFRMAIKFKSNLSTEWKTAEKGFKTKKELEERMKLLLEHSFFIED